MRVTCERFCRQSDLLQGGSVSCLLPSAPPTVGKERGGREALGHVSDVSALLCWQKIYGVKQTLRMGSMSWCDWLKNICKSGVYSCLLHSLKKKKKKSWWIQIIQTAAAGVQPSPKLKTLSPTVCTPTAPHCRTLLPAWLTVLNQNAGNDTWMESRSSIKGGVRFHGWQITVWNVIVVFITCLRSWCYMFTHSDRYRSYIPHCSWTAPLFLVVSTWERQRERTTSVR